MGELKERFIFLNTFLKNPKQIGSITPSSRFLKNSMLKNINFRKAKYIVEYGAGTGILTREILAKTRKDAIIFCFEVNKKLYKYLKNSFNDPRLFIINDSAENIKKYLESYNIPEIDYILSSLPFSNLSRQKKVRIITATLEVLNNSGKFILYRYSNNFKQYLQYYFRKISTIFVPLNLPPTFVYVCQK